MSNGVVYKCHEYSNLTSTLIGDFLACLTIWFVIFATNVLKSYIFSSYHMKVTLNGFVSNINQSSNRTSDFKYQLG